MQVRAAGGHASCGAGGGEHASAAPLDSTKASRPPPTEQQQHQQRPVLDQSQLWADIAAASFGADGVMDGWDSDTEQPKSSESRYLQVRHDQVAGSFLRQCCSSCHVH